MTEETLILLACEALEFWAFQAPDFLVISMSALTGIMDVGYTYGRILPTQAF